MIKNYLKIALRNISRNKSSSFINIGGLAVALTAFLLIMLFVRHELSYDTFLPDSDKIYRLALENKSSQFDQISTVLPEPIAGELKELYPEVETAVRVSGPYENVLVSAETDIFTDGWFSAGSSFFEVFDLPFLHGDPSSALSEPNTVVLTKSFAQSIFGNDDVVGETLSLNQSRDYTVTGVIKDLPSNTHLEIDAIAHRPVYSSLSQWNMKTATTYIKLGPDHGIHELRDKLPSYVENYQKLPKGAIADYSLIAQPLSTIHLYPGTQQVENSRHFYLQVLMGIGILILLLAAINYINLATARASERSKEIGVRKTLGAHRFNIIKQISVESIIITLFGFTLSAVFVELLIPVVQQYFSVNLISLAALDFNWILIILGIIFAVGLLSGAYAAIYLSSFKPADILKSSGIQGKHRSTGMRNALVVAQFTISIAIVIFTLLIAKQMDFVQNERLDGLDDQIVIIHADGSEVSNQFGTFKQELLNHSSVAAVTGGTLPNQINFKMSYRDSTGGSTNLFKFAVEHDYFETMGFEIIEGRDFNPERPTDNTKSMILNQAAVEAFGYEDKLGETIQKPAGRMIGIVENFYSHTLFDQIEPVVIEIRDPNSSRLKSVIVRLNEGQISAGLDYIRQTWRSFNPEKPIVFNFLDEIMDEQYQAEIRLGKIFSVFSIFTIFIACLGLFGLAACATEKRTKEIGIRKVLGASIANIVGLLSKDFLKLVMMGFVIAIPIAWFAMNQWLAEFAYRIEIGPGIFALAGIAALVIALLTVSWQSIKAAVANPVDSLRSE